MFLSLSLFLFLVAVEESLSPIFISHSLLTSQSPIATSCDQN